MTTLWIVFLIANIFLTQWVYRLTRRFGVSKVELVREQIGMSSVDVAGKKARTWIGIYLVGGIAFFVITHMVNELF